MWTVRSKTVHHNRVSNSYHLNHTQHVSTEVRRTHAESGELLEVTQTWAEVRMKPHARNRIPTPLLTEAIGHTPDNRTVHISACRNNGSLAPLSAMHSGVRAVSGTRVGELGRQSNGALSQSGVRTDARPISSNKEASSSGVRTLVNRVSEQMQGPLVPTRRRTAVEFGRHSNGAQSTG